MSVLFLHQLEKIGDEWVREEITSESAVHEVINDVQFLNTFLFLSLVTFSLTYSHLNMYAYKVMGKNPWLEGPDCDLALFTIKES